MSPKPSNNTSSVRRRGRGTSTDLKQSAGRTTPVILDGVELTDAAGIVLQVTMLADLDTRTARVPRPEFTQTHVRDLRSMVELGDDADMRRAAGALLRFADGMSYAKAVAGTGYTAGWIRGLVTRFLAGGVNALRERGFRQPRRSRTTDAQVGSAAEPLADMHDPDPTRHSDDDR